MKLECIKGYAHEVGVVCLQGDVVIVNDFYNEGTVEYEGTVELEGLEGWCAGIEISFSPKIVAEHFKVKYNQAELKSYI